MHSAVCVFQNLQSVSPKVKLEDCESASSADNLEKNRDENILPGKHCFYCTEIY